MPTKPAFRPRAHGGASEDDTVLLNPEDSGQPVRGLRILLIDDSTDMAEAMRLVLQQFGHEVHTANAAAAGLEAARLLCPDVVLCDLGLPGMDGCAVATTLRREPAFAATRLIALSGYVQEADRQRAYEAGFDLHITKPVEPDELQRLLKQVAASLS